MRPKYIEGDLFDDPFDVPTIIAHVCNDKGGWAQGFVVPLGRKFPESKECYCAWCEGRLTDAHKNRLMFLSDIPFERGRTQFVRVGNFEQSIIVANMVAQTLGGTRPIYYNDLARCMDSVTKAVHVVNQAALIANKKLCRIICPMFGSKLAGGDWNFVEKLIEDCWLRQDVDVVVYFLKQFLPSDWKLPTV